MGKLNNQGIKEKCKKELKSFGWSVIEDYNLSSDGRKVTVDFALIGNVEKTVEYFIKGDNVPDIMVEGTRKEEGIRGVVLVLDPQNADDIKKTTDKLKILFEIKPEVLFVTEGCYYETYYRGNYVDTFYTPLSEDKLSHFVRIYMYSKFLNQIREGRK